MLESNYKSNIINAILDSGAKAVKVVTSEYGRRGEPDIMGSWNGQHFVIEAKIFPNVPTAIQETRLTEWANAGSVALVMQYPHHKPEHLTGFLNHYEKQGKWVEGNSLQEAFNQFVVNLDRYNATLEASKSRDLRVHA